MNKYLGQGVGFDVAGVCWDYLVPRIGEPLWRGPEDVQEALPSASAGGQPKAIGTPLLGKPVSVARDSPKYSEKCKTSKSSEK